jgi:hypothetical protein
LPRGLDQAFPAGKFLDAEVRLRARARPPGHRRRPGERGRAATDEDRDLVVWNGDILSGVDLAAAVEHHRSNGAEATLVVREQGPVKNVRITDEGDVTDLRDRRGATDPAYQYTGIRVVTRAFALGVPKEIESLVEHFLRRVGERPGAVQGYLDGSSLWHDLGTLEEFEKSLCRARAADPRPALRRGGRRLVGYLPVADEAVLKGGSGRRFQRVANLSGHTAVLCVYDDSRPGEPPVPVRWPAPCATRPS